MFKNLMARGIYRDKEGEGGSGGDGDSGDGKDKKEEGEGLLGGEGGDKEKGEGGLLDGAKEDPGKAADLEAGGDKDLEKEAADKKAKEEAEKKGEPGERPDWLKNDKFWDADKGEIKTELMNQNLAELNAKFSKGENKAPDKADDYEHGLDEDTAKILIKEGEDGKDPLLSMAKDFFHSKGLSQSDFAEFMGGFATTVAPLIDDGSLEPFDMKGEVAKLGPNGQQLIDAMAAKSGIFVRAGVFNDTDVAEFKIANGTAEGLKMMNKIFEYYGEQSIPVTPSHGEGLPSGTELSEMLNSDKYANDAGYRAEVDALYEKVHPTNPARR